MFVSILVSALLVVCPVIAIITLPNGFTFDETKYLNPDSRASAVPENCEAGYYGCSNDCSAQLYCNEFGKVQDRMECGSYAPYCVKNSSPYPYCSGVFPMEGVCLKKATNYFVCTDDGLYPDPTDCTKYHVCNGTTHHIETCPANHQFTYDIMDPKTIQDRYNYPGNGEYKCRFGNDHGSTCLMCHGFACDGMANQFAFRMDDVFHYAYCIEIGTVKKAIMFKCPPGTKHENTINYTTNSVDCIPIAAAP